MMGCQRSKFNKLICVSQEEAWLKEMGLVRESECNQGRNSESFSDNSKALNIGLINVKKDAETENSYSGWTSSIHWTDYLEILLVVFVVIVAIKMLVVWMRKKNMKKKVEKMEDLKNVLSQQQPQTIPQPPPVSQGFPMVVSQCPVMGEDSKVSVAPTTQIICFNKLLHD